MTDAERMIPIDELPAWDREAHVREQDLERGWISARALAARRTKAERGAASRAVGGSVDRRTTITKSGSFTTELASSR